MRRGRKPTPRACDRSVHITTALSASPGTARPIYDRLEHAKQSIPHFGLLGLHACKTSCRLGGWLLPGRFRGSVAGLLCTAVVADTGLKFPTHPKSSYAIDSNTICSSYSPRPSSWLEHMGRFNMAEPSWKTMRLTCSSTNLKA